jgi:hypothetical protein
MKELTETILDTKSTAKGGIGISIADAKTEAESIVEQIQQQNCPTVNVDNIMGDLTIRGTGSNLDDIRIEQIGDASQECIFNGMADAINKMKSTTGATAAGWLSGGGFLAIVAILVIAGIAIALWRRRKEKKDGEAKARQQKGGAVPVPPVCLSILLIILIVSFCACSK